MKYSQAHWVDRGSGFDKSDQLLFTDHNSFKMREAPRRELHTGIGSLDAFDASFMNIESSGHEIDVCDDTYLTVMLPVQGKVAVQSGLGQFTADSGGVLTFLPSARKTYVQPSGEGNFKAFLLKVPLTSVSLSMKFNLTRARIIHDALLPAQKNSHVALRELINYATTDCASETPVLSSKAAQLSLETLLWEHTRVFLDAHTSDGRRGTPSSTRSVMRAIEYMHSNFAEPLTIEAIATEIGVTTRGLQSAFSQVASLTPWECLTTIRLQNAHLLLRSDQDGRTVTRIALDSGFSHLGRFSKAYFETFGELPSETLKRSN